MDIMLTTTPRQLGPMKHRSHPAIIRPKPVAAPVR